nr:MAG TPA: hypothetical protein [Bacteriophage sp.]
MGYPTIVYKYFILCSGFTHYVNYITSPPY